MNSCKSIANLTVHIGHQKSSGSKTIERYISPCLSSVFLQQLNHLPIQRQTVPFEYDASNDRDMLLYINMLSLTFITGEPTSMISCLFLLLLLFLYNQLSVGVSRLTLPARAEELAHIEPGERVRFRVEDNLVHGQ